MSLTITSDTLPRHFALVPCAGVGERAGVGGPKQYHLVQGKPVIAHTLEALAGVPRITQTLVVLSPGDTQFETHALAYTGWVARCGGATRAESVAAGLAELLVRGAQPHDWVLVHDAARCLLRPEWADRLIDACAPDAVGGLLALPVADTLKQAQDGRAAQTVSRAGKWAAQTPQMFRIGLLQSALAHAGATVTDEASAVEQLGHAPRLVQGDYENLKLTWPGDFALAERLLGSRQASPPAERSEAVHETLLALELALMDPDRSHDAALGALIADDFVEIGARGERHDAAAVRRWVAQGGRPRYLVSGFSAQVLAEGLVLVRYQAQRLDAQGQPLAGSWRSSVWAHQGAGRWVMRAHQGTATTTPLHAST